VENDRIKIRTMTREGFISILKKKGYGYRIDGESLIVDHDGYVWLRGLKALPENVEFRNVGTVALCLNSLPENVEFRNDGNAWLHSLNRLSLADMDSVFQNKADVFIGEYWISDEEFSESRWESVELITEK